MARVSLLSWNIQTYGPTKLYGPNFKRLERFVTRTIVQHNANIAVLIELSLSTADEVCQTLCADLSSITGGATWEYATISSMIGGGGEAYGFLWRTGMNFGIINGRDGQPYVRLSDQQFPDNRGQLFGRRAAIAAFRATDTNVTFVVSAYHAPPGDQYGTYAYAGLEALAKTEGLYQLDMAGQMGQVTGRMLGADFNLDVNNELDYSWLTDDVPRNPPPARRGQGAGMTNITDARTHLISMQTGKSRWGDNISYWGTDENDYIELPIDNVFYRSPRAPNRAGGVIDLLQQVMTPQTPLRIIAELFLTRNFGQPTFPNSHLLPASLTQGILNDVRGAWLLLNYAISDHFPVVAAIDI
jgi:hypothetical protein